MKLLTCKEIIFPTVSLFVSENVGFVRDITVDVIARNIYNKLDCKVSSSCEELGKYLSIEQILSIHHFMKKKILSPSRIHIFLRKSIIVIKDLYFL